MRRLHPILIAIVVGMLAGATGHASVLNATLTNAQEKRDIPTSISIPSVPVTSILKIVAVNDMAVSESFRDNPMTFL
jgi:hypothetical protein